LHERRVPSLRQRIGIDQLVCVLQRSLGRLGQSRHQRLEHTATQRTVVLPFGNAPVVEAVAGGKVDSIEEFPLQQGSAFLQSLERRRIQRRRVGSRRIAGAIGSQKRTQSLDIDLAGIRIETYPVPLRLQAKYPTHVDDIAKLAQAPAQRCARIVRPVP
jgi:hypothetical protein